MKHNRWWLLAALGFTAVALSACAGAPPELSAPGVTLTVDPSGSPQEVSSGVQLMVLLTVLTVAPTIIMLATSFTRIVIVLSILRNAIGTPTVPPNQVVIGLSLLLTFFVMSPVITEMDEQALTPYRKGEMTQAVALERAAQPLRAFMFKQTRQQDLALFLEMSGGERPDTLDDIPATVLLPAFVISELKTAFTMGFVLYVPFLIIEMVVSSVLLSMGMMMLPPSLVSLPFKLLLFVLVDGWFLIARSLLMSFK